MPLFSKHQEQELLWGIWKMEEDTDALISLFSDPSLYSDQIEVFSSEKRLRECLSVRVLLSVLCGEDKRIDYLPSGKPYLADNSYYISISHTQDYVAVILHPSHEVGIDIEKYGNKVCRVRHKFLQPEEDVIPNDADEVYSLLLYWSAKETVYKIMGREDIELKEHLFVEPFSLKERGQFVVRELKTVKEERYPINYITHSDFVLTYCFI